MVIKSLKNGALNRANASGCSLARFLGEISPKISTMTVITAVDTDTPASPSTWVNTIVAREALAIFTILFPIKIVDSILS